MTEQSEHNKHPVEDRLDWAARASAASKEVCALMDEASTEIRRLRALKEPDEGSLEFLKDLTEEQARKVSEALSSTTSKVAQGASEWLKRFVKK